MRGKDISHEGSGWCCGSIEGQYYVILGWRVVRQSDV